MIRTGLLFVAFLAALLLVTLAMPVQVWRTGEQPLPPLDYRPAADNARVDGRLWIDTDPACGTGRTRDPDDCIALFALLRASGASAGGGADRLAGVSTVFGNAPLAVTDFVAREFFSLGLGSGDDAQRRVAVHPGCDEPLPDCRLAPPAAAHRALAEALRAGSLTVVALGPLTNVAAVLEREPQLARNVTRIVAVMGRRPGHLFHPAEGRTDRGMLFGHGPVFRDLNAALDLDAVSAVLRARVPLTLLPYSAARQVLMTRADLDRLASLGAPGQWVATRSESWLDYWREEVGLDGFYPFDAMAAAYVQDPGQFLCADVRAWVGRDPRMWFPRPTALLVAQHGLPERAAEGAARASYCDRVTLRRSLF